jgi:hypothetical protein
LISDTVHEEKLELAGENGIKTVYDLQSYWTSMAAILDSLGFTFLIDRMTEVLTPDIYIELTEYNRLPWVAIAMLALYDEFDTYWQNGGYKKISDIIFAEWHIFIVSNL